MQNKLKKDYLAMLRNKRTKLYDVFKERTPQVKSALLQKFDNVDAVDNLRTAKAEANKINAKINKNPTTGSDTTIKEVRLTPKLQKEKDKIIETTGEHPNSNGDKVPIRIDAATGKKFIFDVDGLAVEVKTPQRTQPEQFLD